MNDSQLDSLKKKQGESVVNQKYTIQRSLHQSFSTHIYTVSFMKDNRQIIRTIKLEVCDGKKVQSNKQTQFIKKYKPTLKKQANVLKNIFKNEREEIVREVGFPRMYEFGNEKDLNYIVQDIYGPNLGQLMKLCGGVFTLRTVMVVCLQIVDRIQKLHQKKFIFNNFEPQNFLVGLGGESYLIFMIDFANAMLYKSTNTDAHISYQKRQSDNQSIFSSINSHLKIQLSRRDDIQSLMYLLVYMLKGKLPWSRMEGKTLQQKNNYILSLKKRVPIEALFKGLPLQLCDLMYYGRSIGFYEKPNYDFVRNKLWIVLMSTDYELLKNNIIQYDWSNRSEIDYEIYRESPCIRLKKGRITVETEEDGGQKQMQVSVEKGRKMQESIENVPDESQD